MKAWRCWFGALLLGGLAQASELTLLDLHLDPDAAWVRGTPEQEREDDALLLSWPLPGGGTGLQLLVPKSPPRLKSDAETFYRNLARKWGAQYGKAAAVGWLTLPEGGEASRQVRWLTCRRPSNTGEGVVFQLATVHAGRAYSLVLIAPAGSEALPQAARELIAGVSFGAAPTAKPAPMAVDVPPRVWRQVRAMALLPQGEALAALAQAESEAMGDAGMLTGYALHALPPEQGLGLTWALDGFRWARRFGRDERVPFEARGQLIASAPANLNGELRLELHVAASETPVAASVALHSYCGAPGPWQEALAALERGARAPLARLAREQPCAAADALAPRARWEALGGEQLRRELALSVPVPAHDAGMRWLEIALAPAPGSVGEGLLERLALLFVYAPGTFDNSPANGDNVPSISKR